LALDSCRVDGRCSSILAAAADSAREAITPSAHHRAINSTYSLPSSLTVDQDQPLAAKGLKLTAAHHHMMGGRSLHLLVVDDSVTIRKMAGMVLRKAGHHVTLAANGQEALQLLLLAVEEEGQHDAFLPKFDAVLMDIQMPIMDGVTATSSYRQAEAKQEHSMKRLLIIGMSACSDDSITIHAHDAGMDYFMPKPFSIHHFLSILKEVDGLFDDA